MPSETQKERDVQMRVVVQTEAAREKYKKSSARERMHNETGELVLCWDVLARINGDVPPKILSKSLKADLQKEKGKTKC